MKKVIIITFIIGFIGAACFSGLVCSMERLDDSPPEVSPEAAEENAIEAMIESWQAQEEETAPAEEEAVVEKDLASAEYVR